METPEEATPGSTDDSASATPPPVPEPVGPASQQDPPPPAAAPPAAAPPPAAPPPPTSWAVPEDLVAGPAPGYHFGGAGERLLGYIVDSLIVTGLAIVVLIVGAVVFAPLPALAIVVWILGIVVVVFGYFPYFWVKSGQTPGLKLFQLHVVRDSDGGPIGLGAAILRLIGLYIVDSIVFGIPFGLLWVFVDKRKRCWHDLLAGTVVVKKTA